MPSHKVLALIKLTILQKITFFGPHLCHYSHNLMIYSFIQSTKTQFLSFYFRILPIKFVGSACKKKVSQERGNTAFFIFDFMTLTSDPEHLLGLPSHYKPYLMYYVSFKYSIRKLKAILTLTDRTSAILNISYIPCSIDNNL